VAALLFDLTGMWCFAVPPVIGLAAVMVRAEFPPAR
jgi:hypothetical protein